MSLGAERLPPIGGRRSPNQLEEGVDTPVTLSQSDVDNEYAARGITNPVIAASLRAVEQEELLPLPVDAVSSSPAPLSPFSDRGPTNNQSGPGPSTAASSSRSRTVSNPSEHELYRRRLDQYLAPMIKSMVCERPEQPHSFIVDYIKMTCCGKERPVTQRRPVADKSFHVYKTTVLDPTIRPLMAELFVTKPPRPLRAIFKHAKHKLNVAESVYAQDLAEIDLFHEMAAAVETQKFGLLAQAIETARTRDRLEESNPVLSRAVRLNDKGQRALAKSQERAVQALDTAVRRADTMFQHMKAKSPEKRLKRMEFLKIDLSRAVAHAHRKNIPDKHPTMKNALMHIVSLDQAYKREQKLVQQDHRDAALRSLGRALVNVIEADEPPGPADYNIITFSLKRAQALRCNPHAPEIQQAAALVATWAHLEDVEAGSSFSLGLVGKMKTQLSRHARDAKVRVQEIRAAQEELDRKLEDSDDEFYREMGYSDDDADGSDDDDSEDGVGDRKPVDSEKQQAEDGEQGEETGGESLSDASGSANVPVPGSRAALV
eukprot:INCI876.1.p1 GENE.INCI876.1~~INCI876.1.p1  ORF type:complete len:545 (-),score=95.59 INCI876.1:57-1691(-)